METSKSDELKTTHGMSKVKYARLLNFIHVVVFALSVLIVVTVSVDAFRDRDFLNDPFFMQLQVVVCCFFLVCYGVEGAVSPNKITYFWKNILFLLVSIPWIFVIEHVNIQLTEEQNYLLRFIPLVRGAYALGFMVAWVKQSKVATLFWVYLMLLVSMIYFSSLIFFVLEHNVNPMARSYANGLWWAAMDVTTVGSNIYAVTPVGKVLSVFLAALGMMMFPIFTVYITSKVEKKKGTSSLN